MEVRRRPPRRDASQIFFGDEANHNPPLPGYGKVDLHTSYDVTENMQIYGLIDNLFNLAVRSVRQLLRSRAANEAPEADPATGDDFFTNPRTITPAPPITAYGGLKVHY